MAYNFTDRLDTLGKRMKGINGEKMLYSDNFSAPTFILTLDQVTRGRTECEEIQLEGPNTIVRLIDFFVDSEQLCLKGVPFSPVHGHQFKDTKGRIYTVVSGPGNTPTYCYTTPSETRMRVHTSRVK